MRTSMADFDERQVIALVTWLSSGAVMALQKIVRVGVVLTRYRHGCDPPPLRHSQFTFISSVLRQLISPLFRLGRFRPQNCSCAGIPIRASSALGLLACSRGGGNRSPLQRDLYERSH